MKSPGELQDQEQSSGGGGEAVEVGVQDQGQRPWRLLNHANHACFKAEGSVKGRSELG